MECDSEKEIETHIERGRERESDSESMALTCTYKTEIGIQWGNQSVCVNLFIFRQIANHAQQ